MTIAARMPMIAITVRSSMRVNPRRLARTDVAERTPLRDGIRMLKKGLVKGRRGKRRDSFGEKWRAQADFPRVAAQFRGGTTPAAPGIHEVRCGAFGPRQ